MNQNFALKQILNQYTDDKSIEGLALQLDEINKSKNIKRLIDFYDHCIPLIEKTIWKDNNNELTIKNYQRIFHELENLIQKNNKTDSRHRFIIAIPVADRPQHLTTCLNSIFSLCDYYRYGNLKNGIYEKICVLIADDSKQKKNIIANMEITENFTNMGLEVIYFGSDQQKEILRELNKNELQNIIGNNSIDNIFHKGASITRNITYLKLQQLHDKNKKTLFYFVDSDQEFKVNIPLPDKDYEYYGLNYFYHLDRIFSNKDISILTGKVVGDPPVSPAVMAGTFLDDIINFTSRLSELSPFHKCKFHCEINHHVSDAAYHDMADLFGFKNSSNSYDYRCPLVTEHNHIDCFKHFCTQLNHFFDGEHPTRKSYYQHTDVISSIQPARTIYTGNYIFKPENLKFFIPFANLKLRMAGPVLGRIIKAKLNDKFVSANLPMLHKRTINNLGQSEFRPGVSHQQSSIDLSGEFIRQFFGDVMLFSIIELNALGFPDKTITYDIIYNSVSLTIESMQGKYLSKRKEILEKTTTLNQALNNPDKWWSNTSELSQTINNFKSFINNIEFNFNNNSTIFKTLHSKDILDKYHTEISDAIFDYRADMKNWKKTLSRHTAVI
jgi:hypothetical protein